MNFLLGREVFITFLNLIFLIFLDKLYLFTISPCLPCCKLITQLLAVSLDSSLTQYFCEYYIFKPAFHIAYTRNVTFLWFLCRSVFLDCNFFKSLHVAHMFSTLYSWLPSELSLLLLNCLNLLRNWLSYKRKGMTEVQYYFLCSARNCSITLLNFWKQCTLGFLFHIFHRPLLHNAYPNVGCLSWCRQNIVFLIVNKKIRSCLFLF